MWGRQKGGPIAPVLRDRIEHPYAGYAYHQGDVFTPGAGNYVFEPALALMPFAIQGRGIFAGAAPNPLQCPQIMVRLAVPVVGVGGLIHGQMITQGLLAPDNED